MATAVQPTTSEPQQPATPDGGSPLVGSVLGAVVFLAGAVAAGYLATSSALAALPYAEAFRMAAYLGGLAVAVFAAGRVAGLNPARGLRGGLILTVSALIALAWVAHALAVNLAGTAFGLPVVIVVAVAAVFGVYRMLTSGTGRGWANTLEDHGWADYHSYKRTQGLHVRRYTMIGALLVGLSGAWAVFHSQMAGTGDAAFTVPFTDLKVPLLPARELLVPVLLAAATLWVSWRLVNVPVFADFLIATEAEMNKVSWTSRKKLIQDTIVVLVCVVLLTLFLLVIDLFWGWLLSQRFIGVLPHRDETNKQQQVAPDGTIKLNW